MKSLAMIVFSVLAVVVAYLGMALSGPSYSESSPLVPPWPVFKLAIRVSEFLRSAFLASNPGNLLFNYHGISYMSTTSLYVVAKLGVADVLLDRSLDYADVAKAVGADPQKLFRIITYLSSEGVFAINGRNVSLTANGQYLRTDHEGSMRWCMLHWNEEAAEAMHFLKHEVTTGEEAFHKAFGTDIFSLYEQRPNSTEAFTKCMKGLFQSANPAMAAEYDFSRHHTLLDLGGGMGTATMAVLSQHSKEVKPSSSLTSAIVFDLEKTVSHGNLKHEIMKYQAGSFFEPSTIPSADVILINGVLHDWNDQECAQILTNAAAKLEANGRIIVADFAVPDRGHPFFNVITRLDVFMMTISSGWFRTTPEYDAVWKLANLKVVEARPTRSLNTVWILAKQ